ncbi:bacteriophage resistance gene pglZ [Planomonospora sphaerica]|uniref:Bacteriophage resistance gene pglZ n=1 Tax=Planomonospora sphaerica TaxID=161355 RepID=A0A161LII0_9ACTN|nr:BREX-2 system phosphatase PglZ [Planomonospora sphaerica]GAT68504.1 bacteriophage resistance gene pglZ [Planomonospora sphaerica]
MDTVKVQSLQLPQASRAVVEQAVRRTVARQDPERIIALRAAPEWRDAPFLPIDGHRVEVRACGTVLAVLDAVASRTDADYLVLLTPCEDLGDSLLARIAEHELRPVNRFDLVREAFGARLVDPRLSSRDRVWLAEALIDAQPPGGWPKLGGGVLTLETAVRTLASARFHGEMDAATLLAWASRPVDVARFQVLPDAERAGLRDWLESEIGPVASVVFRLTSAGHAADAVPLGLVTAVVFSDRAARKQTALQARVRIEERFFGGSRLSAQAIRQFSETAESLWTRWLSDPATAQQAIGAAARAEQLLAEVQAESLADLSDALTLGFDARLNALGDALVTRDFAEAERALTLVREHRMSARRTEETRIAEMAVRLARWLAAPLQTPPVLGALATVHLREWGWVDRAIAAVQHPDTARTPRLQEAYGALYRDARARRTELDKVFADRLAAWTASGSDPDELVLAENLLDRVVRPLSAPLVVVLDGMSAAVAAELAEGILGTWGWVEIGRRKDGREPALAVIPSMTRFSRTSLLCGRLQEGTQREEVPGFRAMWPGRRSALFHKGDLPGDAGAKLDDEVLAAIADTSTVVGIVLNAVDDALDKGPRDGRDSWSLHEVAYLPQVLAAAWSAGRSVVLTSDHGHVLHRDAPVAAERSASARYRSGTAGEGEVLLRGPRVLAEDGEVVAPWDESIRYTAKHAGYHGGASPAEMVIPILVFVPGERYCPSGWQVFDPAQHAPAWWNGPVLTEAPTVVAPRKQAAKRQEEALFTAAEAVGDSLGRRVVESAVFEEQRGFVRNAPASDQIARLVDGLAAAGGKMPVSAAAALVDQPPARMRGYVSQASRLLNLEGYGVLTLTDGDRTVALDVSTLKLQFLGGNG